MKILYIRDPVWNPDKREWVINYGVSDYVDDRNIKYVQKITTETLISAVNYTKLLEEQMEKTMRKIILSQEGCSKCKTLASQVPDAEVETDTATIMNLARALNIRELPIVVLTGTPSELAEVLK